MKKLNLEVSGHLLRYNLTYAINFMYDVTPSHEKFIPKSLNGLDHHKGSKNEPSKQKMRSDRLMKHNSNFNSELESVHTADF